MTVLHVLALWGGSIIGAGLREFAAINKRDRSKPFSWLHYWTFNQTIIIWNVLGMIALLLCSGLIFHVEAILLVKMGVKDIDKVMPLLFAPTGIIIGYGGGALVRKLLKKGAEKAGLEDVYNQVEEKVEIGPDKVTTTKTETTITTPTVPPPTPPPSNG
jgi:hypothetical protein